MHNSELDRCLFKTVSTQKPYSFLSCLTVSKPAAFNLFDLETEIAGKRNYYNTKTICELYSKCSLRTSPTNFSKKLPPPPTHKNKKKYGQLRLFSTF